MKKPTTPLDALIFGFVCAAGGAVLMFLLLWSLA